MGNQGSVFDDRQLEEYQELTYFTKKEILHVYKKFRQLNPSFVDANRDGRLDMDVIMSLPELKANPFNERICKVFSSTSSGDMSFEDFLDMMSVFSEAAPKHVKVEYAFRIYDFDDDDVLSRGDLKNVVNHLTGNEVLEADDLEQLISNILEEADLDNDGALSFAEFEHVISKAPDFVNSFRIRV
ncbi:DgyrCDS13383 [Dimorphilus gyrociliatus]|uniref:DgyrCDS13383 n=1 Tax=Dimorphilus gyrociliatus TaxID=2664684 RepID=A0A7I8WAI9_9ANNE|nr:DgyrCDS13383 [Dimorphilus gyrociliatus]